MKRVSLHLAALVLLAASLLAAVGCGGAGTPKPTAVVIPRDTATAIPPASPPAFPLIFAGTFTVAGKSGQAGLKIFARIGGTRSAAAETFDGTYRNIIIGPSRPEDQKGDIAFFLGDPDGKTVQAAETYTFRMVGQPTTLVLDLSFPSLP